METPANKFWRVKTPTVLQMEAVECGAAALAIVLGYFKKYVPLEQLREACGVSRDGSKASNIVKAARTYGMNAKGFRFEIEELLALRKPIIVFWNFNHFLVVEGESKKGIHLNDPAAGPRVVSRDEFDKSFTGVALVIEPSESFLPDGKAETIFTRLRSRLPITEPALHFLVLAGLLLVIPGLVLPTFAKSFVDEFLIGRMDSWVKPLLLGMALTMTVQGLLTALQKYYLLRFQTKLAVTTSGKFLWHVLRLPVGFFEQRSAGDISGRVALNNKVADLITGDFANTLLNLVVLLFYFVLMLTYDSVLTAVGVSIAAINVMMLLLLAKSRKDINQKLSNDYGKLVGTSMGGLQIIETLKATGTESDFYARWAGIHAKVINSMQVIGRQDVLIRTIPTILTSLNTVAILSLGGFRVMDGALTMGGLVAFQSLMTSFLQPVNQLVALSARVQEIEGDMKRLDDVQKYEVLPELKSILIQPKTNPDSAQLNAKLSGLIEIRNLCFGYSKLGPALLDNFSLTIKPGSRVALIGGSGCGKSTVARLVMGLQQPWSGEILFDGQPREQLPRHVVNQSLAMVSQEISMFEGSVSSNLSLWDESIAEELISKAAQDAVIHDIIVSRQGGYDAQVVEGGGNFSGGQRQRLEIARALSLNPTILVLDEATSALDPVTEQIIDDNLRRRGCSCLIVAHRLSTIRDCDEIIVLDRGRIAQRGTHEEMIGLPGPYADLMNSDKEH